MICLWAWHPPLQGQEPGNSSATPPALTADRTLRAEGRTLEKAVPSPSAPSQEGLRGFSGWLTCAPSHSLLSHSGLSSQSLQT